MTNGTISKPASPKQLKWLRDLLNEHDTNGWPNEWRATADRLRELFGKLADDGYEPESLNVWLAIKGGVELTHDDFQRLLPKLQAAPTVAGKPGKTLPDATQVPEGRYGIPTEEGAINKMAFYKVDRPTEGKWAGRVFVKLQISDRLERLAFPTQVAILNKIAEYGAAKASANYGHEFKHCGVCGRGLTNDESRELGIGPVCASKMGW